MTQPFTWDWKLEHYEKTNEFLHYPGRPYAIIVPPCPMWQIEVDDGRLNPRPVILLRASIQESDFRVRGCWEIWEYAVRMRTGSPQWLPVFNVEENYAKYHGGRVLGIASGEFIESDWQMILEPLLERERRRVANREKANSKAREYRAAARAKTS